MFIVFLRFSNNKASAPEHMDEHNAWLKQGFDDGVFVLAGSIEPGQGGTVWAHNTSMSELKQRVQADPFVAGDVVSAEIIEISPKKTDERLGFLAG